jgi:di/tricarboxylate transporter
VLSLAHALSLEAAKRTDLRRRHPVRLRARDLWESAASRGLIPLGWAMDSSGTAAWVAGHTVERLPEGIPIWVLELAIALLTTAFSLVISHVGATIVMVPLAINLALAAGGNPTAFALIVALSASNNIMSASNPVISMITGPANYTSRQLWRVGGPLSLIYTVVVVLVINLMFWWSARGG